MADNGNVEEMKIFQEKISRIEQQIDQKQSELNALKDEYTRYREHTLDFADEAFVVEIETQFENEANDVNLLQHRFKAIRTLTECKIKSRNMEREIKALLKDKDDVEEEKKYLNKTTAELYREMMQLKKDYIASNSLYVDQIHELQHDNDEHKNRMVVLEAEVAHLKEIVGPLLQSLEEIKTVRQREPLSLNLVPDKCSPGIILDRDTNTVNGMIDKADGYGYAISSAALVANVCFVLEVLECSSLVLGIIGNTSPATISYPDNTNYAWNSGGNVFIAGVSNKNHGGFDSFTKGDKMVFKFTGSSLLMYHVQKKKQFQISSLPANKSFYMHIYMYKNNNKVHVRKPTEEELRTAAF